MRIIRGSRKGKVLSPPAGLPVRPTTDAAKEGLFNIIEHAWEWEGLHVLDLFAGTGNLSFEFVSRGCSQVTALDMNPRCTDWIRQTASHLEFDNLYVVRSEAFSYLRAAGTRYHLITADPPYDMPESIRIPDMVFERGMLHPGGWLILEHPRELDFSQHPCFLMHKVYGKVNFSFFEAPEN